MTDQEPPFGERARVLQVVTTMPDGPGIEVAHVLAGHIGRLEEAESRGFDLDARAIALEIVERIYALTLRVQAPRPEGLSS